MQYIQRVLVIAGLLFVSACPGYPQDVISGTEPPASYDSVKTRVMDRSRRREQSQAIQEVAQVYREMVSAFKANRLVRAEEMSQRLDELLADPVLPRSFSEKIHRKHERFLARAYGPLDLAEVPDEDVTDKEIQTIQKQIQNRPLPAHASRREDVSVQSLPEVEQVPVQAPVAAIQSDFVKEDPLPLPQKAVRKRESQQPSVKAPATAERGLTSAESRVTSGGSSSESPGYVMSPEETQHYLELYYQQQIEKKELLAKEFEHKVEVLYADGVAFYEKNAYRIAYDILNQVEKVSPGYKSTGQYLSELKRYFELEDEERPSTKIRNADRQKIIDEALAQYSSAENSR